MKIFIFCLVSLQNLFSLYGISNFIIGVNKEVQGSNIFKREYMDKTI